MTDNVQNVQLIMTQGVLLKRLAVNTHIYRKFAGVIQYGPLKGFKILEDTSWGNDKAAKILGFYEAEILFDLAACIQGKHFVDLGAADGYYAVGFVANNIAKSAIAFESSEQGRNIIAKTADNANVADKITIYGTADEDFISLIDRPLAETVFLMDIEGGEFNLLTRANLAKLKQSCVFVEIHDFDQQAKSAYKQLLSLASEFFHINEIKKIGRNPYAYEELAELDDSEHWLACSEGRSPDAKWIKLTPLK